MIIGVGIRRIMQCKPICDRYLALKTVVARARIMNLPSDKVAYFSSRLFPVGAKPMPTLEAAN
jgi:hypothetical protein